MSRTKLGLLGLCAVVLGTMALSVSSAQGATLSWLVLNSPGTTATELLAALVGKLDSAHLILLTKIVKLMISVTCGDFELLNMNIAGVGQIETGSQVKFTGCAVYTTAPLTNKICDVHSPGQPNGIIVTNKLKGKLSLHTLTGGGTEVLAEIAPEIGTQIADLLMLGETCSLPELNSVDGVAFFKDCLKQAATHAVEHLVEQGPLTSLTVGSDTAEHLETSLIGSSLIKLGGAHTGLKWAAMDA